MMSALLIAVLAQSEPAPSCVDDTDRIVVTASLLPVERRASPVPVSVIDRDRLDALGEPLALDVLRLTPSVSVASSGPPGSQAQLRIRGAEASHTLLLVDGIRFNDPASGNEARFELLSTDGIGRIEVVRGPQSALYGAEAIGGVVSVATAIGGRGTDVTASVEGGGKGFRRLSGSAASGTDRAGFGIYGGYQESDGIDSFAGSEGGDRDGFDNLTFGGSARVGRTSGFSAAASARFTEADSEYDGFDPATFARTDTLDATRNRIGAGRVSLAYGDAAASPLHVAVGATLLASTNRNLLDGDSLNETSGRRTTVDGLASATFRTGTITHRVIVAGDYENERFVAGDQNFGGGTNQRRTRDRAAIVGEVRSALGDRLTTDIAARHDSFDAFRYATTVRAAIVARIAGPFSILASYGTGIARPTFFDLFGFFPGSFAGNSSIGPERSRGGEIGARYDTTRFEFGVTAYRQRLRDEIIDVFDPVTFISSTANATGTSRRRGVEVNGTWRPSPALRFSGAYALLNADEPAATGTALVKEVRRPRHSASLAADARLGPLTGGASLAYVGARTDTDFGSLPAQPVRLGEYVLAGARLAYRITPQLELFGRVINLFDADYQDVVGYATQGRTVYGGVRVRLGD